MKRRKRTPATSGPRLAVHSVGEEFDCPFCKGQGQVCETLVGRPTVMHTEPVCETFFRLEALEYLAEVNRRSRMH